MAIKWLSLDLVRSLAVKTVNCLAPAWTKWKSTKQIQNKNWKQEHPDIFHSVIFLSSFAQHTFQISSRWLYHTIHIQPNTPKHFPVYFYLRFSSRLILCESMCALCNKIILQRDYLAMRLCEPCTLYVLQKKRWSKYSKFQVKRNNRQPKKKKEKQHTGPEKIKKILLVLSNKARKYTDGI